MDKELEEKSNEDIKNKLEKFILKALDKERISDKELEVLPEMLKIWIQLNTSPI